MARFTFEGWNLGTWLVKNKNNLKLIVSGATGLCATFVTGLDPVYSVPLGVIVSAASKMILDAIDYYQAK